MKSATRCFSLMLAERWEDNYTKIDKEIWKSESKTSVECLFKTATSLGGVGR